MNAVPPELILYSLASYIFYVRKMYDYGLPTLDSSIVADGWVKDAGRKLSKEAKKAAKSASKFIKEKAPRVIGKAVKEGLETLMDTGSLSAAVARVVSTAASESVDIGKTEAEQMIRKSYNKEAGTSYAHADFISFASGLPMHHKLLRKRMGHSAVKPMVHYNPHENPFTHEQMVRKPSSRELGVIDQAGSVLG
jgi:hypothetical protein